MVPFYLRPSVATWLPAQHLKHSRSDPPGAASAAKAAPAAQVFLPQVTRLPAPGALTGSLTWDLHPLAPPAIVRHNATIAGADQPRLQGEPTSWQGGALQMSEPMSSRLTISSHPFLLLLRLVSPTLSLLLSRSVMPAPRSLSLATPCLPPCPRRFTFCPLACSLQVSCPCSALLVPWMAPRFVCSKALTVLGSGTQVRSHCTCSL